MNDLNSLHFSGIPFAKSIKKLIRSHNAADIVALRISHNAALRELETCHKSELRRLRNEHKQELAVVEREVRSIGRQLHMARHQDDDELFERLHTGRERLFDEIRRIKNEYTEKVNGEYVRWCKESGRLDASFIAEMKSRSDESARLYADLRAEAMKMAVATREAVVAAAGQADAAPLEQEGGAR